MVNLLEISKGLFLLVPIGILLSVGGLLALNSGVSRPEGGSSVWRYMGNLGSLIMQLACVLALLLILQQSVGLGLGLNLGR